MLQDLQYDKSGHLSNYKVTDKTVNNQAALDVNINAACR